MKNTSDDWSPPDFSGGIHNIHGGRIKLPTPEDIERVYEQAREEAFSVGYKDGLATGSEEIHKKILLLGELLTSMTRPLRDVDRSVGEELVLLSQAIAASIIRKEVIVDSAAILSSFQEAMDLLPSSRKKVKIMVNPSDVESVRSFLEVHNEADCSVIATQDISAGGCKIITDVSEIDSTVESRIKKVAEFLLDEVSREYGS